MEKAKKDLDYPKENERIEPQERVSMCFLAKKDVVVAKYMSSGIYTKTSS